MVQTLLAITALQFSSVWVKVLALCWHRKLRCRDGRRGTGGKDLFGVLDSKFSLWNHDTFLFLSHLGNQVIASRKHTPWPSLWRADKGWAGCPRCSFPPVSLLSLHPGSSPPSYKAFWGEIHSSHWIVTQSLLDNSTDFLSLLGKHWNNKICFPMLPRIRTSDGFALR